MAKVLIAEDDRISQRLAAQVVENMGHTAFVSPHGRHAYEALLACNDFSLLVTDIMMPHMDGRQLIQTLRSDDSFLRLPIIIMSAVVGVSEISNLLTLGATWFVAKPIQPDEMRSYIMRGLGPAQAL